MDDSELAREHEQLMIGAVGAVAVVVTIAMHLTGGYVCQSVHVQLASMFRILRAMNLFLIPLT